MILRSSSAIECNLVQLSIPAVTGKQKKSCRRSSFLHWINTFNYIQSRFAICLGTKINLPQLFISKDYTQSISFTMDPVKS